VIGERVSHYEIESRLGKGGMGEVFLARDLALGRPVALKLLPQSFDPAHRRRLLREAEAARRLQHPGIATYFEGGESDGTAFVASEYVQGETLRARLARGAMPAADALPLASGLLEALCHAHAAGIIHRDIKPENIMVTGETTAKLLDFGLAQRVGEIDELPAPTVTLVTAPGSVVGTVGYMAPEQLQGRVADQRADLFALGAVLHEMLSGQAAFPGGNMAARMAATLFSDPPPVAGAAADLQAILRRALARDPDKRYPSAPEFLRDLRRLAEGRVVAAFPDSLAILDFENRSGESADEWIGAGIAESLTTDLKRTGAIEIVPRARVKALTPPNARPGEIGAVLGCRWVLSGSFQKLGPALRAIMEITHVPTDEVTSSEKLDGQVSDLFAVQDQLAERAAAAMSLREREPERDGRAQTTLGAYECYMRGQDQFIRMSKGTFDRAEDLFEEAIRSEPTYADALAGLAAVHDMRFTFTTEPAELERAVAFARRAVAADPDHAAAHVWLGYGLWRMGRIEEGLDAMSRAQTFDPASIYPPYFAACMHLERRNPAAALPLYQGAVARGPGFGFAWVGLAHTHLQLGHDAEAVWSFGKALELESHGFHATAGAAGFLGECLRRQGRLEEARAQCLAGLDHVERTDHMYRDTFRAVCLNALGRTALDQGDVEAARTAFHQCELHLGGRPRTLGGGFLIAQAMAGLAAAGGDAALLAAARQALDTRAELDWSWFWTCEEQTTREDLQRATRMR
jgi:serine/threonine-protein kinase